MRTHLITLINVMLIASMAGCTNIPADLGRSDVADLLLDRGHAEAGGDLDVSQLLQNPLDRQTAVTIALINNPELQTTYAKLGFGAADLYRAARIRNPVFEGAWLDSDEASAGNLVTLGLAVSFTDLLTLRARRRLSESQLAVLKMSIGGDVLTMVQETESAFYDYLVKKQISNLRERTSKTGSLSAALAQRLREAGNLSPRELAIEESIASEARLVSFSAQASAWSARVSLANLLGISVADDWEVQSQIREPLKQEDDLEDLVRIAKQTRLDLLAAQAQADMLVDKYDVVGWSRWVAGLEGGVEREREPDGEELTGPTLHWELPVFSQRKDRDYQVQADLTIAAQELRQKHILVENQVRLAYAAVQNAKSRVREYQEVLIPQRKKVVARGQEEVNFMLIGIFELLALKQQEYDSYQGYFESVRDYWQARSSLAQAVGRRLPSGDSDASPPIDLRQFFESDTSTSHEHHHSSAKAGGAQ
ncbi:MAG: TolC family protein [Pseudomonadota bacterium]